MTTFGQFGIDAAVEWGPKVYFFRGTQYIRVSRTGSTGPGVIDPGYPRDIHPHWNFPDGFGANGISAATMHPYLPNRYYFFSRGRFIEVRRTGDTGPGEVLGPPRDDSRFYPAKGSSGLPINGAIKWGLDVTYFFRGDQFATFHRSGPGHSDEDWTWGTRANISAYWGQWNGFGDSGIDDAVRWGTGAYVYVFKGPRYIRIYTISATGFSDRVDPGYPRTIDPHWNFPAL